MSSKKEHLGFVVGAAYKIHTHLGIWLGRITAMTLDEITLDECSWIPDEGRMGAATRDGTLKEIEFVGDGVIVPRNSVRIPWRHALPKADK